MTEAFVGFGSNVGDKIANIREGARMLRESDGIQALELSPLYRTAPVGKTDQDWFVNAVARVRLSVSVRALLERCLEVERALKRERQERWGPRTLDLDVLLFGSDRIKEEGLEVPHPRMLQRAFVLAPLADLRPELVIEGKPVWEWLNASGIADQALERLPL